MRKKLTLEKEKSTLERQREEFIKISKKFFKEFGKELNSENGEQLPKDINMTNKFALEQEWSVDVFVLLPTGIRSAYYRGKDPNFTVHGVSMHDLYLKDCNLLINKFITKDQLDNELNPKLSHLKVV